MTAPPPPAGGLADDFLPADPVGRMSIDELRADVPTAVRFAVLTAVAGVLVGVLWAVLAPGQHLVSLAGAGSGALDGESDHLFDAVAVFFLLVTAFGVVVGAVAWRMRRRRGPVLLVAAVAGSLIAGWLAAVVGTWLASAGSPTPVLVDRALASASGTPGPPVPATLTVAAATLGSWWGILACGLAAALAYLLPAIWNGHEDMSREV